MKDKRLIIRLKSGDKKALSRIMDKYSAYAYTIARNTAGQLPKEDIEEIVSDSFVALWSSADKLFEDCELSPYIAAIVRNQARNKFRNFRQDVIYEDVDESLADKHDFQVNLDLIEAVRAAMAAAEMLSDTEREIFIRHYWYGEKLEPISEKLGLTLSNCKTKLHRTKTNIRKYLIERGYGYEKK